MKRLYFDLLQSAIVVRLGRAEPALGEEAAGERAVGEQAHAVREAEGAHRLGGAAVEERERDLVASTIGKPCSHEERAGGRCRSW